MDKIGLPETIEALRAELRQAVAEGQDQDIQFPVGEVQLEFQVGITREGNVDGKLNVWVLELGVGGSYAKESVQTVTLTLESPVDAQGQPIKIRRRSAEKP
jgi:Trypsin-co-occurring domain 2